MGSFTKNRDSFLYGIGSLLNIRGFGSFDKKTYLNGNVEEDMSKDWRQVGDDIRKSMQAL